MENYHIPVLTNEVVRYMNLTPRGVYVDCTVGGGGHSFALLEAMSNIQLYCFDQDDDAIRQAKKQLLKYQKQVTFIKDNFINIKTRLALHKINKVDGILMDIGVSNHQITSNKRGFSFMQDSPLDMRMDKSAGLSAFEVINHYTLNDLTRIFFQYGEEQYSKKIAQNIIKQREIEEIKTTAQLAEIIEQSLPKVNNIKSKARIFQAIRIEVNNELDILQVSLKDAISLLKPTGRLLVISWHSLEDRIVKNIFKAESGECVCPPELPVCNCKQRQRLNIITKKAIKPTEEEIASNSNARSAKMRVAERTQPSTLHTQPSKKERL